MIRTRAARNDDFAAIAAVALACGQPPTDSGADAAYLAHLSGHGHIEVAVDTSGEIVGFGGTKPVGSACILTDLFVVPALQGRGIGRAILEHLWSRAGRARLTFSSQDPRALPLYLRFGLKPRWPLLYLSGEHERLGQGPLTVRNLTAGEASAAENGLTGIDRSADYEYWLRGDSSTGLAILDRGDVVAVAAATTSGVVHLACTSEAHASEAAVAALSACSSDTVTVALPGPHPAVPVLLACGFSIDDQDIHMSSDDVILPPTSAYSPALG
jgi:GNAT superfamily N-acetyltransferase